jgi:hypothetical protein
MPPCIDQQLGVGPQRVLKYDKDSPAVFSLVREVIKRVAASEVQHFVGKAAARWIIREKLRQRAAAGPDALTTTKPILVDSPMKILQQIRANQVTRLRPNILTFQRPGFRGAKRKTLLARGTGTKRSRKCGCTSG